MALHKFRAALFFMSDSSLPHFDTDALAAGTTLHGGALIIARVLAHSNFAITYAARDEHLRREVAVKEFFPFGCRRDGTLGVLPPAIAPAEDFTSARARFLEEARVLAQFHHPGVVAVHAFFEANNTAYMVMELLDGSTLREQLEARGRFAQDEVLALVQKIGATLEAVHAAHLLHRDLKPDNVFVCKDERIVLLDFGLSTRLEADAYGTRRLDSLTRFGTPGYAPPEQYTQGSTQNAAADVYSLGATLYHLLTGTAPPPAPDRAFGAALEAPARLVAGVSTPISHAIMRAMRLKPQQRPQSVRAFLTLLNIGQETEAARAALLGVLRARVRQLKQLEKSQRTKQLAASQNSQTQNLQNSATVRTQPLGAKTDDSGCLQFAFVAYLMLWLLAAVVCGAWFFVQFIAAHW
jgi:serine/threonine-protein kinase